MPLKLINLPLPIPIKSLRYLNVSFQGKEAQRPINLLLRFRSENDVIPLLVGLGVYIIHLEC